MLDQVVRRSVCMCILNIWTFELNYQEKSRARRRCDIRNGKNSDAGQMNDINSKISISQNVNTPGKVNSVYSSCPWPTEVSNRCRPSS
jgi:hypothetical protein